MDAKELWQQLSLEHPERAARIAERVSLNVLSARDLVEQLMDLRSTASIGNDKCGTTGNPYEQPTEDLGILFSAAQRISGVQGRFRWERG